MGDDVIQIGPYRLGKTLGVGSFSKVKRAIHIPTGRKVAVKILNKLKLNAMNMGLKARREIDFLRLFNHPHIIRLYEVIETSKDLYVVMEYVSGGELFDHIVSNGKLSEYEARKLFQQIISGVEYCHTHMVVHRDLKPENLLLDKNLNMKIADFGLSNMMKDGHFLKTSCGSPNYAAPEVISGLLYAGPEVDIWSCGVILYALICGTLPFDDANIPNLFKKIKGGEYTIPSKLSKGVKSLIPKMLEVDPVKRITIEQIRKDPWFQIDLPIYLQISYKQNIEKPLTGINDEILLRITNMGYDHEKVKKAISLGPDLLTNNNFKNKEMKDEERNDLRKTAVAYHLLCDYYREKNNYNGMVKLRGENDANEADKKLKFSNDTLENLSLNDNDYMKFTNFSFSPNLIPPPKSTWYLGIWGTRSAEDVMKGIFLVLKNLNMEWKIISSYKIKTRYLLKESNLNSEENKYVKIGIQLYKTNFCTEANDKLGETISYPKSYSKCKFVVDIQKLVGEMFPFLDLCTKIVGHLEVIGNDNSK